MDALELNEINPQFGVANEDNEAREPDFMMVELPNCNRIEPDPDQGAENVGNNYGMFLNIIVLGIVIFVLINIISWMIVIAIQFVYFVN